MLRFLICLVTLGSLVACTGIRNDTQPPEVSVSNIALAGAGLFEQRWQVTLRVRNPNQHKLRIRNLQYQVFVEDQPFARGSSDREIALPALGETLVSTELTTHLLQNLNRALALLEKNDTPLPYRIEGKALLGSMPLPLGFSWQGELPAAN